MTDLIYNQALNLLKKIVISWGKDKDVYMVGGAVRDLILKREIKDIDLCIDSPTGSADFMEYLKKNWSEVTKDFVVYLRYGTAKFSLILPSGLIDIECVIPRTESYNEGPRKPDSIQYTSIQEDAKRRDFCCNALYMNVVTEEILDPTGYGIEDVKNKVLRTPLDPELTFRDDPLRMLRAFRFAYQKGFTIMPFVLEKIKPYKEYYELSKERINDEFSKMLTSDDPVGAIRDLHASGLLENIIPELEEGWDFNQNSKYHSMTLSEHLLSVLSIVSETRVNYRELELRLAALLHDISKYRNHKVESDGHFSYHLHELYSADMAEIILSRLHYSNDTISYVKDLIQNHMRIKSLYDYSSHTYTGSLKTTRKIYRECGKYLDDLMILINADNLSHAPEYNMPGQTKSFWEKWNEMIERGLGITESKILQPVSGASIMTRYNLKAGKTIGYIKDIFQDWFDENPNLTEEDLLERYSKDFGEGRSITIFKDGDVLRATDRPLDDENKPSPWEYAYEIENGDFKMPEGKFSIQVSPIEYPQIYLRMIKYRKSREIVHKIANLARELSDLSGFEKLDLRYYNDGDIQADINWRNQKTDYIR